MYNNVLGLRLPFLGANADHVGERDARRFRDLEVGLGHVAITLGVVQGQVVVVRNLSWKA